jgi:putative transposase
VKPAQKREGVQFLQVGFRVSERRACRVMGMQRTRYHYRSRAPDQSPLLQRIREIAAVRVRYGYRRVHSLLRPAGRLADQREARLPPVSARRALAAAQGAQEAGQCAPRGAHAAAGAQ